MENIDKLVYFVIKYLHLSLESILQLLLVLCVKFDDILRANYIPFPSMEEANINLETKELLGL